MQDLFTTKSEGFLFFFAYFPRHTMFWIIPISLFL